MIKTMFGRFFPSARPEEAELKHPLTAKEAVPTEAAFKKARRDK